MKKPSKRFLVLIAAILLAAALVWLHAAYPADDIAAAVAALPDTVRNGRFTLLQPESPGDTGIIFYPGAKVKADAYLPLLDQLRQEGYTCVLARMPLNMAFFGVNAAKKAAALSPETEHWYLCGHSLGGAMASSFAAKNPDTVDGLILLGSYIYGDYPEEDALTIYGSLNSSVGKKIHYTKNIVVIGGGNHAQFGNYGPQRGDLPALISAEDQQKQTVDAITEFIEDRKGS